ncbi:TonB-dependent receptor [Luteimonas fraxinea]|uniref:TonB-dependent receptor n=1 Tax=Luteimonas fraxinea TaxID=2901869 RepID=A0ABS8U6F7_9GAMM|nr:TonB-dependent receptor [Luteimonas fraxinea]MCD9095361.1 TonB-dependent receptor [Luteimonas fraxinea]
MRTHTLRRAISIALFAVANGATSLATAQDADQREAAQVANEAQDAQHFDLPPTALDASLGAVGAQSGLRITYPPSLVANRPGPAVQGRMHWREAMARLLQGSGLEYRQADDGTVVIAPAHAEPERRVAPASADARTSQGANATDLETITVTGTRIRGGTTPSPVITLGSERIREEGFADLGEVIRSVPQNFSGGQNPGVAAGATQGAGGLANQNLSGGSSLNLRGLGPDATLTLLNGRRLSYGGYVQAVDIGAIPVEAVERIEIVPDGASAIYGSDAVGGVGNVILKRDYEGVTLGTRYGRSAAGGLGTRDYAVTAGAQWERGGAILTYKDVSVDPIRADQRTYTAQLPSPTSIYPGSELRSALLSVHHAIGDAAELRLDALATRRSQDYSYYYETTTASYNRLTPDTRASFLAPGVDIFLPGDWTLTFGATHGRDDLENLNTGVDLATAAVVPRIDECLCNDSRSYEVGAEGPVFALPAGDIRLAAGMGTRRNAFQHLNHLTGRTTLDAEEASRFAYAEAGVPLMGSGAGKPDAARLELTAALRHEDYDSFGAVTTPRLGALYAPGSTFTLKASWGRSFKAPTLYQMHASRLAQLVPAAYVGGAGYAPEATVLIQGGGNRDLDAERARTQTASVAFHPDAVPGLLAELTWFRIAYTDRVVQPITNAARALADPNYAPFVEYAPSSQRLDEVLASVENFYNSTGAVYVPSDVAALVRYGYTNVAEQQIEGLDLSGSYGFALGPGRLTVRGAVSWLDIAQKTSPLAPAFDVSGTLYNPARVNGRFGTAWSQGPVSASLFGNYTSGVTDTARAQKTGSFTTFDAALRYASERPSGLFSGTELAVNAQNIFNRNPPLHTPSSWIHPAYDSTNYSAIGRFVSVSLSKHF